MRVIAADLADATSLDAIPAESQAGILFGNVLHCFADPLPLPRAARTKLNDSGAVVVLVRRRAREPAGAAPAAAASPAFNLADARTAVAFQSWRLHGGTTSFERA